MQLGSLNDPTGIEPKMERFTRRLRWVKPLDLSQFENMPGYQSSGDLPAPIRRIGCAIDTLTATGGAAAVVGISRKGY